MQQRFLLQILLLAQHVSGITMPITNLFRHTNVKISYKCSNTVAQLTKPTTSRNIPPHDKSGVYSLTCKTCNLSYVGQTSRNLKIRFQEHIRYIKTNSPQSAYAQYILQNRHEYGTLAEPIQQESMLLPSEQFHIQSLHQAGKLISEQCLNDPNPLFQLAFSHPHYTRHKTQPVNQHPANRTHNPQLHTRPATSKTTDMYFFTSNARNYPPRPQSYNHTLQTGYLTHRPSYTLQKNLPRTPTHSPHDIRHTL